MGLDDYSFKAFSQHDFYRQVNEWLLDRMGLKRGWTVLDVACGCGVVTELIAERIRGGGNAVVIGLDMSASALRHRRVTTWLAEGKNPVHVKEALGHADLATTMGYTHLAREHLRSLVETEPKREELRDLA
jgi:site-specific recombinase XerD